MALPRFTQSVLKVIEQIPYGKVVSYGQVALFVGVPRAAIQVGQVLHHHGASLDSLGRPIPWWRVVNNAGRISIKGHESHTPIMQKDYLLSEGVVVTDDLTLTIEDYRWRPTMEIINSLELDDMYIESIIKKYII